MTINRKLLAVAALTFGAVLPLQAGVIKGSFTAAESTSWTQGPTSSPPSGSYVDATPPVVSVAISQRGRSISKVVLSSTDVEGTTTTKTTETFFPSKRKYTVKETTVETDEGNTETDVFSDSGLYRGKLRAPKGKGKKSRGGKIKLTFTADPDNYTNVEGTFFTSRTTTIDVKLGRRSSMSYNDVSSYGYRKLSTETYDETTTRSGSGKATGRFSE